MEENNYKKEERTDMTSNFTFSDQFEEKARVLILRMINQEFNSVEIPDSDGQIIIREKVDGVETGEFKERIAEPDILMVPFKIKNGDTVETFYVCSR